MGSPWIDVSTNFLTAYAGYEYIGDLNYLMLTSFWIFGLSAALYVTVSLISPEKTKIILALSIVLSMIMFFVVYALIPAEIIEIKSFFESTPAQPGGLTGLLELYLLLLYY